MLRDVFPDRNREINALADASTESVPADLVALKGNTHPNLRMAQLTSRLIDNRGMQEQLAEWTVHTWAAAINSGSEEGKGYTLNCPACGGSIRCNGKMTGEVINCSNSACDERLRIFANGHNIALEPRNGIHTPVGIIVATDGTGQFTSLSEAVANAPGGSCIELRGGPFEAAIKVTRSITLRGNDPAQRVILRSTTASGLNMRAGELRMENLQLELTQQGVPSRKPAFEFSGANAVLINCSFQSEIGTTVKILGKDTTARFERCQFRSARGDGLNVFNHAQVLLQDCDIVDTLGSGLSLDDGASATLKECLIQGCRASAISSHKGALKIENSRIENAGDYGLSISHGTFEIRNTMISRNRSQGIWVRNSAKGSIEGCDLRNNSRGAITAPFDGSVAMRNNILD